MVIGSELIIDNGWLFRKLLNGPNSLYFGF